MPSWSEHRKYCMEHGINENICNFANEIVDYPEKTIPKYLEDPVIREVVSHKLSIPIPMLNQIIQETIQVSKRMEGNICKDCKYHDACYISQTISLNLLFEIKENCLLNKHYPLAITHLRVHTYWEKLDLVQTQDELAIIHYNLFKNIVKEIARYFYGDKGVKAVELHLELDEVDHIINELRRKIPAYLSRGVKGTGVNKNKSILPIPSLIRKYISKDQAYLVQVLKQTQNFEVFLDNFIRLLAMRVESFFREYNSAYFGVLKDKLVIEVILEYPEKLCFLKDLLNLLKKDIVDILSKLEDLTNRGENEINRIIYDALGDDEFVEEIKEFLLSEEFRKLMKILRSI